MRTSSGWRCTGVRGSSTKSTAVPSVKRCARRFSFGIGLKNGFMQCTPPRHFKKVKSQRENFSGENSPVSVFFGTLFSSSAQEGGDPSLIRFSFFRLFHFGGKYLLIPSRMSSGGAGVWVGIASPLSPHFPFDSSRGAGEVFKGVCRRNVFFQQNSREKECSV